MSKKEFMGQVFISFFVVVTCINLGMAFMGMIYAPDTRFGYEALLFPVFYGFLGILPSAVLWLAADKKVKKLNAQLKRFQDRESDIQMER